MKLRTENVTFHGTLGIDFFKSLSWYDINLFGTRYAKITF